MSRDRRHQPRRLQALQDDPELLLRPATAATEFDDREDVLGAAREDTGPDLDPRYVAACEAITIDPNQLLAVAVDHAAVVGCLQISFIPGLSRLGMMRGRSKVCG